MSDLKWYIIQVVSNHEQKVKEALENRDFKEGDAAIKEIYLPYTVYRTKTGKQKRKAMFPGYLYVKLKMTDDTWYIIRNTEYVTGIVGSSGQRTKPTPITEQQIEKIKQREIEELKAQKNIEKNIEDVSGKKDILTKVDFEIGDFIEISEGEFVGKKAKIIAISLSKQTFTIKFEMFGREQIVEIPFNYAKKIK